MLNSKPERWQIMAAFTAVYIIWGSTYLTIKFAIETIPPFLMAGVRFAIAGLLLYGWLRARGKKHPQLSHLFPLVLISTLLLVVGNLGVVLAEKTVATGLCSLLVAMVPIYVALLDWLRPNGVRPSARLVGGLLIGLIGMVTLIGPAQILGGKGLDLGGVACVLFGSLCWSAGSLYSRHAHLPESPLMATAMQMLIAGVFLLVISCAIGEPAHVNLAAISSKSILSVLYLITFGSIVGFSAYVWLLKHVSTSRVSTYAYVNPIVAVLLGCAFNGEHLTTQSMMAAGVILSAVWLITGAGQRISQPVLDDISPVADLEPCAIGAE